MIGSTDIEKEIKIIKELKNNILKEENIHTHAIIDKYFNIIIYDAVMMIMLIFTKR